MEKTIGLVIATISEFKAVFGNKNINYKTIENFPFVIEELEIEGKKIIAINSGVGEVYASMATQYLIDHYSPSLILNYGVVGSLRDDLNLKSTIIIDQIFDYEFDTSAIDNCPVGYRDEFKSIYIKGIDEKYKTFIQKTFPNLELVNCASGNKFIADVEIKNSLFNKYHCSICEMEALGIALTAIKNQIPTIFIKGVSDTKTGGAEEFSKMINESSSTTFELVVELIKHI